MLERLREQIFISVKIYHHITMVLSFYWKVFPEITVWSDKKPSLHLDIFNPYKYCIFKENLSTVLKRLHKHTNARGLKSSRRYHWRSYHFIEIVLPERTVCSDGKYLLWNGIPYRRMKNVRWNGIRVLYQLRDITILRWSYLSTEKSFRRELCGLMRTIPPP